ncbi:MULTISPECIES: hypothetical protein [Chryseobacterium]|uniref:DUF3828 domain-containing protein n=1 Tax=Chryseobacterium camelliae TaxID=1265445 RepID=A0ABU0TJ72_9FLAO|nr:MULTISPECIES: hypothetical protein [Chryseobacterium]MDT3405876.1 hypothetical protein [Pseudacidovorax intermedius]MDQ1096320.1 hypothetical protein [Chryseobacterium camelliae]MDQ1100259.1 hypothetical protein [Chryseobacterium sp. SORGH_AS_1048]MDR6087602.1 hypothetical protein [Chryseobacterium sp. SORGH_AS_0909]MDR6131976.1 hypothetical protein [Chryseobacterium sp. SORGH_AS_1175]
MKALFYSFFAFLTFVSCNPDKRKPEAANAKAEISRKVNQLYTLYGKAGKDIYSHPVPGDLFTSELNRMLDQSLEISKIDTERVKKSLHPEDKPLLLEGSVFTGLYEGFTAYHIQSIDVSESIPSVYTAKVKVEIENSAVSPKVQWTDTVLLTDGPDTEWKIDNINFDSIGSTSDLKTELRNFIDAAKAN